MSILVNILTTYNGAGAKKAMRDLAVMQKQATLAGSNMTAGMLAASASMTRIGARTAAVGSTMSRRMTLPILGFAAASVYAAEKVQKGLNKIRSGTGATGKKLEELEESFRNVAKNSGKDFETIGTVVADLNTRLGLTGKPLETVASRFLTLSRITGQEVAPMLTEVSKAMNDAGVKSGDTAAFLDKLLVASQKTGASVQDLSSEMYRYGSPLRQLGFGVDQTIATLASFDKAGVNTKLVMGSLRIALGKMAKAGEKDLPAALAKGVAAIKSAKTGGEAAAKAVELFGARAGPDMAAAIREGRFEVADLVKQLQNSGGAVERTGKATLTFSGKMKVLRNQAALVGEGFGLILLPYLQKLATGVLALIRRFQGLGKGTRDIIIKVALFVAAIGPVLVIVGKLTSGVGRLVGVVGKLSLAFGKAGAAAPKWARAVAAAAKAVAAFVKQAVLAIASLVRQAAAWIANTAALVAHRVASLAAAAAQKTQAAAQWLLNAALTANPIGLVIVAIAAMVAIFVVAYKKSETFRRIVTKAWDAIKRATRAVFDWITGFFRRWGPLILKVLIGPIGNLVLQIVRHWNRIRDGAAAAFNAVIGLARSLPGRIRSAIGSGAKLLYGFGADVLRGVWSGMQSIAGWLKNKIYSFFKNLLPGWARKALGISSPSTVFAEIGRRAAEGMARGMTGGQPMVRQAALALAGAALPPFGGPGGFRVAGAAAGRAGGIVVARGAVQVELHVGPGANHADVRAAARVGVGDALARLAREIKAL